MNTKVRTRDEKIQISVDSAIIAYHDLLIEHGYGDVGKYLVEKIKGTEYEDMDIIDLILRIFTQCYYSALIGVEGFVKKDLEGRKDPLKDPLLVSHLYNMDKIESGGFSDILYGFIQTLSDKDLMKGIGELQDD
jgi:hypothetical protein